MKLKHLFYWLFKAKGSGCVIPKEKDKRDFEIGGWFGYTPKHREKIIKTYSLKDQRNLNTCVFNAATIQKEVDEKCVLSVRSLVAYAKKMGLLSGNGWSTLKNGQKALQDYGILEEKDCPDIMHENWNAYTNIDFQESKASEHKIQSYWSVTSRNAILEQLDNDRILHCALDWYTGFNQGGGFKFPWIILKIIGWLVGGHSVALKGYIFNYKGEDVYVFQNSYGMWGDKGDFYITMNYFDKNCLRKYGAYVNKDIPVDVAKWLTQNNNKVVKKNSSADVFLIQNNKKRKFKDLATLYSWGYLDSDIIEVEQDYLDKVEEGEELSFWDGKNVKSIKAIIMQKKELKNIFVNYFSELF